MFYQYLPILAAIQLSDSEFFNLDEIFDDVQKIRGGNSSFQVLINCQTVWADLKHCIYFF